jgi:hypothetical protein
VFLAGRCFSRAFARRRLLLAAAVRLSQRADRTFDRSGRRVT